MSDINFLENKKPGDDQELKDKDKDGKKKKLIWSSPKKQAGGLKSSPFYFLPFMNKPAADKNSVSAVADKNKIKQSRKEILSLMKHYENSGPPAKEKGKNFLAGLVEKLKRRLAPKEILVDYQQVFNQEKEHKDQVEKIFSVKPAPEDKLSETKETKKEIKTFQPETLPKKEVKQRVLETNLIQGELVTFFDWRAKVIVLVSAILMPIFVIGAVYYGLLFYHKSTQAKNLAQEKKFSELEKNILQEESDLSKILAFQAKLKIVSQIFEQHLYWTNFFKFLEDNTIKDVYFVNFDGDTSGNYVLEALAADYGSIDEQVKVFKSNKKITSVSVNGGELTKGDKSDKSLVKFTLNFSVLKNIFTD